MLTFHDLSQGARVPGPAAGAPLPPSIAWIDASSPSPEESQAIKSLTGIVLPPPEQIAAIEPSNRLYRSGDSLVLTVPALPLSKQPTAHTTPLAFIVTADVLVTLRYDGAKVVDGEKPIAPKSVEGGGTAALAAVLGALVGSLADELEDLAATLNAYSQTIFGPRPRRAGPPNLRPMIVNIGLARAKASQIGQGLNGLQRLFAYLPSETGDTLSPATQQRMDLIARDVTSLNAYEEHTSEKIQFLLDSVVGMIGVDQNEIFKILTVLSVVGIPPTVVAGVYGMNFKNMPEYDWAYGYQYVLTLLVLSVLLPALWFKWKRWW